MLEFQTMTDDSRAVELQQMMHGLYAEDLADSGNHPSEIEFERTSRVLLQSPERGRIVLFQEAGELLGYAILIPYWSNEFGGTILFVDELFVKPASRRRGIGRRFFEWIRITRPFDSTVCALEVAPKNLAARKLYESIGFKPRTYTLLVSRMT